MKSQTTDFQATPQATPQAERLVLCCEKVRSREELQQLLGIKDRMYFSKAYLLPALEAGLIEQTIPEKPKSPLQKYKLTGKGLQLIEDGVETD